MATKAKVKKKTCKGTWRPFFENGKFSYKCTNCHERLTAEEGRKATNHREET